VPVVEFLRSYGALYAVALVIGIYCGVNAATQSIIAPLVQFVFSYGAATFLALWACRDARSRQSTPCFDFGMFVFFTWYITVPAYLVVTRGWRGVLIAFTAVLTIFVVTITSTIVLFVLEGIFV
jgi:hypothetical protein